MIFKRKKKSLMLLEYPLWTESEFRAVSFEHYKSNYAVFAVVNKIAKSIAGISLIVYRQDEEGYIEVPEHPVSEALQNPNPNQGWAQFIEVAVVDLLITGNSYIRKIEGSNKTLIELHRINPFSSISKTKEYFNINGEKVDKSEILHLMLPNPYDENFGLSPMLVGSPIIHALNHMLKWNQSLLRREGRPAGLLKVKGFVSPAERENIREQFLDTYGGARSIGTPIVVEGDAEWQPLSYSPKEMDWEKSERLNLIKICSIYGVPPELVFEVEHKTYSNYREARKAFYQETVLPLMDILASELNRFFLPQYEDIYIDYDKDKVEALSEEHGEIWKRAIDGWQSGLLTLNEARELLGYEKIEGGDTFILPGNFVPSSMILGMQEGESD